MKTSIKLAKAAKIKFNHDGDGIGVKVVEGGKTYHYYFLVAHDPANKVGEKIAFCDGVAEIVEIV